MNTVRPMRPAPGARKFGWHNVRNVVIPATLFSWVAFMFFAWDETPWWAYPVVPVLQTFVVSLVELIWPGPVRAQDKYFE